MFEMTKYRFSRFVRQGIAPWLIAISGAVGSGYAMHDYQREDPSSQGGPQQSETVSVFEGHIDSLAEQYSKYSGFGAAISSAQLSGNTEEVNQLKNDQASTYTEMMRQAKSFDQELFINTSISEKDAKNLAEEFNEVFVLDEHQINDSLMPYIHEAQKESIQRYSDDRGQAASEVRRQAQELHRADESDNGGEFIFFSVVGGALAFGLFGGISSGSSTVRAWGYNKPAKKPGLIEKYKNRPKTKPN